MCLIHLSQPHGNLGVLLLWEDNTGKEWAIVGWHVSAEILAAATAKTYTHNSCDGLQEHMDFDLTLQTPRITAERLDAVCTLKAALETIMSEDAKSIICLVILKSKPL